MGIQKTVGFWKKKTKKPKNWAFKIYEVSGLLLTFLSMKIERRIYKFESKKLTEIINHLTRINGE